MSETAEAETTTVETTTDAPATTAPDAGDDGAPAYESEDGALARLFGGGTKETPKEAPAKTEGSTAAEPAKADGKAAETNPTELERSIGVLRRDGAPESLARSLAKTNPAEFAAWVSKAEARQKAGDAIGNRVKELEGKAGKADAKSDTKPAESDQQAADTAAAEERELDDAFKGISDAIGDEPAKAIRKVFDGKVAGLTRRQEQLETELNSTRHQHESFMAAAQVLHESSAPIGQMRPLLLRMSELGKQNPGQFADRTALARAAAESLSIKPAAAGDQPAATPSESERRSMTPQEQEEVVLEQLFRGRSVGDAQRLAGIRSE